MSNCCDSETNTSEPTAAATKKPIRNELLKQSAWVSGNTVAAETASANLAQVLRDWVATYHGQCLHYANWRASPALELLVDVLPFRVRADRSLRRSRFLYLC